MLLEHFPPDKTRIAKKDMTAKMTTGLCFLCQIPCDQKCQKCDYDIYYCSKSHYAPHLGRYKGAEVCYGFKTANKPIVGNVMVAAKDIRGKQDSLPVKQMSIIDVGM